MEQFKQIEGFDGYMISNHGRVKSIGRDWHNERGKSKKDIILKPRERRHGYYATALYKNKKQYNVSVHRLVAQAFVTNPNDHNEVNHKDGNKQNNLAENLEWCTHSYNAQHAVDNGYHKIPKGSQMHNSKLNESLVKELRELFHLGKVTIRGSARKFNVSKTTMSYAIRGKTWSHI